METPKPKQLEKIKIDLSRFPSWDEVKENLKDKKVKDLGNEKTLYEENIMRLRTLVKQTRYRDEIKMHQKKMFEGYDPGQKVRFEIDIRKRKK